MKCIEDEIPFEAPDGWEWARLGSIAEADLGKMLDAAKNKGLPRPYLRNINVRWGVFDLTDLLEMRIQDEEVERYSVLKGDLVVCEGGEPGRCAIWEAENGVFFQKALHRVRPHLVSSEYVFLVIYALSLSGLTERYFTGTTIKHLTGQALKALLIPIPPIHEQGRICGAANKALDIVDDIEENKEVLVSTLSLAKSRILDLAIRGLLVPQNPDDEPASVLLDRICKEKEMLIKHGKIKRDKRESIIFRGDDNSYYERVGQDVVDIAEELPFSIPDSWYWARISSVFEINPRNRLNDELDVSFIPMPLIEDGFSGRHTSEIKKWGAVKTGFTHFSEGDIGIAKITPCFENRKSTVFCNLVNGFGAGTTELHVLRSYGNMILPEYALAFVKTQAFINAGKQEFTGAVGQQRVGKEYISETLFPVPPYQEQVRIVEAIRRAFSTIGEIETAIA